MPAVAARLVQTPVSFPPSSSLPSRQFLILQISKFITAALSSASPFAGSDLSTAQSCEVDTYMDLAASYDGAPIAPLLDHLNSRLALRTFLVGHSSTLADLLCWAALKRRDFSTSAAHPHVSRWFSFIDSFPGFSLARQKYCHFNHPASSLVAACAAAVQERATLESAETVKAAKMCVPQPSRGMRPHLMPA